MDMKQSIASRLKTLEPRIFEFQDDSHLHVGHAGNRGGGPYRTLVVSPLLRGLTRLERQRTVKGLLQDLFSDGLIHALSIKALTPEEYFN